jgi:hypothetical protein
MKFLNKIFNGQINIKSEDFIFNLLLVVSMGLSIWGIVIYRMTIIPLKYLFAVMALGAVIAYPLIKFKLKPSYENSRIFLTSVAIGAGLFYFSFLYLNSRFLDKEKLTKDFNIVETGTLAKGRKGVCRQPYAIVDFYGIKKELIFYCEYEHTISTFSKVKLEFSKGLFGFNFIHTKTLIR